MYKILTGREGLDRDKFFTASNMEHGLRGHSKKLFKPRCNTTARLKTFSMRAIDDWNRLPGEVVDATSVNKFKNKLDKHWADMSLRKAE